MTKSDYGDGDEERRKNNTEEQRLEDARTHEEAERRVRNDYYQRLLAEGKPVYSRGTSWPNPHLHWSEQRMWPDFTLLDEIRRGIITYPHPDDLCGACFSANHQLKECPFPNNPAG